VAELLHTAVAGLPPPRVGKVREVYDLGAEVLIVATDRISAFDVVMANGIPDKGAILNQMSAFWFAFLQGVCPNHVVTVKDAEIAQRLPSSHPELAGRTLLARKTEPLPVECVARGYLTGSLYKEYKTQGGKLHGLELPENLEDGSRLPEPIFTPATKATVGHDENISFAQMVDRVGTEVAERARAWTLELYRQAAAHAIERGIIIADTKFEFGLVDSELILIDEALTPDSSRFWSVETWRPGQAQPSYDKQFVRDYLETLTWDKKPPGPELPEPVIQGTRARYLEAFERLTGRAFT
jgi:phosphoribosylaminoimidazole-succinocarboxamide synthase